MNKNVKLFNLFKKETINNKSLSLLALSAIPALFVTVSLEATIIYLLAFLVFIVLSVLLSKIVNKFIPKEVRWIAILIVFISLATLIQLFINALLIDFDQQFGLYIYVFAASALPYFLYNENKEEKIGRSLVSALQVFLGFATLLIIVAFFAEILATGTLAFGVYTNINFSLELFPKYAFTVLNNGLGALLVLGIVLAVINIFVNREGEQQ